MQDNIESAIDENANNIGNLTDLNAPEKNKSDKRAYTSIPSFYPFFNRFYCFVTNNFSNTSLREIS